MPQVISVQPQREFRLEVSFDDGTHGVVEMKHRLFGPVFEELNDWGAFRQVSIDEFGAVCWPNGADLAPDGLYERTRQGDAVVPAQ